jgi:hypothetical protein
MAAGLTLGSVEGSSSTTGKGDSETDGSDTGTSLGDSLAGGTWHIGKRSSRQRPQGEII